MKKKEQDIPVKRAISNNMYALKLTYQLSKKRVVWEAFIRFISYFEWLFYSAFFMRYVIQAMQNNESFWKIVLFLAIAETTFGIVSICHNYMGGNVVPITSVVIYKKLYQKLFKKSRNVELACFEDSNFYNRYTLAMDGASEKLCDTTKNIWGVSFGLVAAIVAFAVMYQIDAISVLFVIFPLIGNFLFNSQLNNLDFKRNKEIAPHKRKVDYVNRVMYLADFAKEVRLTNVFPMMKRKYEEAIEGMVDVTKKYRSRGVFLHWFRVMFTFTFIFEGVKQIGFKGETTNQSKRKKKKLYTTGIVFK